MHMERFDNPFSTDRAEQLGNNLFEFYASHKSFEGLLKMKSLILEGGRGSGKTMFYLYNTYFSKKSEYLSHGKQFSDLWGELELIGLHYRADTNFVPAFQRKGISDDDWIAIFGHYLNIHLTKRLVEVIIDINTNLKGEKIEFLIADDSTLILQSESPIISFKELLSTLKRREIELISFVNNSGQQQRPNVIMNGYLLNSLAKTIVSQEVFNGKTIHFFIDEYENMLPYQQKVINTLIKHPDPVIFDVGMRKGGLKTYRTLGDTETICAPHDYDLFDLEDLTDSEYEELVVKICEKRLSMVEELVKEGDPDLLDIRNYLGKYKLGAEFDSNYTKIKEDLRVKLKTKLGVKRSEYSELIDDEDIINLRLNIVLLERGKKPSEILALVSQYNKTKKGGYKDLIHNNKYGIVFLLCKEYRKDKLYTGFNTFKSLSSGITRLFIELCEVAFKNARRNGFSFSTPRLLTPIEQTDAAQSVSKYKVNDIETYSPHSVRMKRFVLLLGNVFRKLHNDKRISEPERNHFSTEYDKLSNESHNFLNSCLLYTVLQKKEETKKKRTLISTNNIEFHLNHIYAPYFEISARKIRSLGLRTEELERLIGDDVSKAEWTANKLTKENLGIDSQPSLF